MVNTLISAVTGRLISKGSEYVDIEISGITLRISTPITTVENIGNLGDEVKILTSLQMRQDSLTLYGFVTENDRNATINFGRAEEKTSTNITISCAD